MEDVDGKIRIKVNLDPSEIDKDMEKLSDKLSRQNSALEKQKIIVEKLTSRYEILYEKAMQKATPNIESAKIFSQIEEVELKYKELQDLYITSKLEPTVDETKLRQILSDLETLDKKLIDLRKNYQEAQFSPDMQNKLRVLGKEIDLAVAKEEKLTSEVRNTEQAMKDLSQRKISDTIDKTAKSFETMSEKLKNISSDKGIFESISQSIGGIGRRIMRLASSAFVFNTISAGFREMSKWIRNLISQDDVLSNSLARVRANLVTAFYPIYQAILPALRSLGRALEWITSQLAVFISTLTGTSLKSNRQGAKEMFIRAQGLEKEAKGYQKVGKSAKKASGELANFDKINVLNTNNDNISESPSVGPSTPKIEGFSKELNNIDSSPIQRLIDKFKELSKIFKVGFDKGFVDKNFNQIYQSLVRIGKATKEIFGNPKVATAFNKSMESVIYNLGRVTGSAVSVGTTIGKLLTGSIAKFLEQSREKIQNQLIRMFDIKTRISNLAGDFAEAFATVFKAFSSDQAQNTVANALSGIEALIGDFALNVRDITTTIAEEFLNPFIQNKDKIREIFEEEFKGIETFSEGVKGLFEELGKLIDSVTEKAIKPALKALGQIWQDVFGDIINAWKENISPVLNEIGERFKRMVEERINPSLERVKDSFGRTIGPIISLVQTLWNLLRPFVTWLINESFSRVADMISLSFDTISFIIVSATRLIEGFQRAVESMVSGAIWSINQLIDGINFAIRSINRIRFDFPNWLGGGSFRANVPEIPRVPRLAQGAVLEGGNPFLAWLGDQPRGQTNIETPLSTMVEAFNQALRQNRTNEVGNITIEASGDVGKLISFLDFKLKQENQRIGNNLVTGDVWV